MAQGCQWQNELPPAITPCLSPSLYLPIFLCLLWKQDTGYKTHTNRFIVQK